MNSQSDAATGGSDESTPTEGEQEQVEHATLLDAVLAERSSRFLGEQKQEEKPKEEPKVEVKAEAEPEETEPEPQEEPEKVETEEPITAEAKSEDEEEEIPVEAPEWYRNRMRKESEKRRARTRERDTAIAEREQWKQQATQLHQQLQAAQQPLPQPTPDNPLADIFDAQSLNQKKAQYENIQRFAEENLAEFEPGQTEIEAQVGRLKSGEPRVETFTKKKLIDLKLTSERVLREGIPQRIGYLNAIAESDRQAQEMYPDLADPNSEMLQQARQMIREFPQITLRPDFPIIVAHYVAKLREYEASKNGATKKKADTEKLSPAARKIVEAPKVPIAPGIPKRRTVPTPSEGADIDTARKQMQQAKTPEARQAFIAAKLRQGRSMSRQPVLA